jgi:hypothetical protein
MTHSPAGQNASVMRMKCEYPHRNARVRREQPQFLHTEERNVSSEESAGAMRSAPLLTSVSQAVPRLSLSAVRKRAAERQREGHDGRLDQE